MVNGHARTGGYFIRGLVICLMCLIGAVDSTVAAPGGISINLYAGDQSVL